MIPTPAALNKRTKKRKITKLKIKPFNVSPTKKRRKDSNSNSTPKAIQSEEVQSPNSQLLNTKITQQNEEKQSLHQSHHEWDNVLNDTTSLFDESDIPNDVELVFNKLHSEFPSKVLNPFPLLIGNDNVIYAIPVILLSQIYSLIEDHTMVDRYIDEMKKQNKIRHFRVQIERSKRKKVIHGLHALNTNIHRNRNQSVHHQFYDNGLIDVYVRTEDYKAFIAQNIQNRITLRNDTEILNRFMNELIPHYVHHTISRKELRKYLMVKGDGKQKEKDIKQWMDGALKLLVRCGLITLKIDDLYCFQYPKADRITPSISEGRKEVIYLIRKRRYQQILKKEILRYQMKKSCLDAMFHFRDLLGAQIIKQTPCATGNLVEMI